MKEERVAIGVRLAVLHTLDHPNLRERFEGLYGVSPPKRIGRKLLVLAIAYEMQRRACGVSAGRIQKKLTAFDLSPSRAVSGRDQSARRRSVKEGGRLLREWRGKTYEVLIEESGCYLEGRKFNSLSAAATAITGVKRNGPAFFGLRSARVGVQ